MHPRFFTRGIGTPASTPLCPILLRGVDGRRSYSAYAHASRSEFTMHIERKIESRDFFALEFLRVLSLGRRSDEMAIRPLKRTFALIYIEIYDTAR